jgi:signal transduction histidine kinase
MRAHCVLRDVEPGRDLVGTEVLVEEEENLDLAGGELLCNLFGDAAHSPALPDAIEEPARDRPGECSLAVCDSAEEEGNALWRLALQEVSSRPCPDRFEEVLVRPGGCEDNDFALRRCLANVRKGGQAVHAGHRQIEQHEAWAKSPRLGDRFCAIRRLANDIETVLSEEGGQCLPCEWVIVGDQDALHRGLIGSTRPADEGDVQSHPSDRYRSWLAGELLLVCLLGLGTVLLAVTNRLDGYELPNARIALDTAVAVVAIIVALLAAIRFLVEGRGMDLLLAAGFLAIGLGTAIFAVVAAIAVNKAAPVAAWAAIGAALFGTALFALAPFVARRVTKRKRALAVTLGIVGVALLGVWIDSRVLRLDFGAGPTGDARSASVIVAYALLTVLSLVAVVGFGLRYRRHGRDLDSWLTLALTLVVFADLHYVLAPARSSDYVLQSDLLRILAFAVLLVGVWRAIGSAEFGRAVAEERARVAREIHDGLAQYLFALSTQVSMLESGAALDEILPRLKYAVTGAQQEAQFAVLALSSAAGSAPFDSALKRYVDFLVADGEIDVEVQIDPKVTLAPDEEIEVFRIVQEGLANARKHADARQVEVSIIQQGDRRIVRVADDGAGFENDDPGAGQGLKNMRARAAAIQGAFSLSSAPGKGTAIEVVLRAV